MPQETLEWVVDRILHEGQAHFTLYQIARQLEQDGWTGMAKVLEQHCIDLEDALGWVKTR